MTAIKLDALDLKILNEIQHNGRITKLALAEKVGLSPTPTWIRLRKLEKLGVIKGYHASLNLRAIAPIATVLVEVTLRSHRQSDFDRFERVVRNSPEIVCCWSVGGGIDYMMKVMAEDIDAYQRLIDSLLDQEIGIDRYFTYVVTRTVKEDEAMSLMHLLSKR